MPPKNTARRALRAGALLSAALFSFTASAQAPAAGTPPVVVPTAGDSEVLRATLDNGLQVVIVRNSLAPVAATSVNYLVGSDETPAGFPGTSHALEHMMIRGSPGLTADQLADI